ncbi:acyl-CoA thioesterase II [Desulfuromonas versatilis]|uniref:Acyl-CoA thioesterase II n=1 Tax=Desulfuromonas versatilis TaxID=2802975 RepID=A0ABN6DX55_9BACT|nr:acyl-CoA thioesterase II [Desulfuromonas versatilis]BCR04713.1 acyl-CoA thioesterase II [Desulfuromonas versatilis]
MKNLVQDLVKHLTLERLEENLFRGESRDVGQKSVFGGQVLGQALMAAARTVEGRQAHSLHGYFLLPGDPRAPIVYDVERIRDGRSFTTRRVVAIQHGRAIFNMAASFQIREQGVEHQAQMPEVPGPEGLADKAELGRRAAERASGRVRRFLLQPRPIEFRPVAPDDPLEPEPRPPQRQLWLRAAAALPDDPALHQAVLAYASDFSLLGTAFLPHGLSFLQRQVQAASLDHAMWFHREFRLDDWLLYAMDSPSAGNARGLCRGSIFTRDGKLVASVAQEGLIRKVDDHGE